MKIACLQFAPTIGTVNENIARADQILEAADVKAGDLELLALPELAFTGYNFLSHEEIRPYLEPTAAGISTHWAIRTALRLRCTVIVGYPEVSSSPAEDARGTRASPDALDAAYSLGKPVVPNSDPTFPHNYNSTVTVSAEGKVVAHYRKSHLYYTDAIWAREGDGFYVGQPFATQDGKGETAAMGICMDMNNYNFTAPWTAFEFANHIMTSQASIAIVNMAWLSHDLTAEDISGAMKAEPELSTLSYWVERLKPVVERKDNARTIVVLANRCGTEPGVEKEVCYAGTSTVLGLGDGQIEIWDILGKGEEGLLVVDTDAQAKFRLASRQKTLPIDDDVV